MKGCCTSLSTHC